ncbi:MAG TPA: lysophospholipid acyltransferase family protein, partial [Tepidisphaeraceae bacterium]|nr:lysophospholipid acyltransferase family protein [Tepidisphaeraceae bacterium]
QTIRLLQEGALLNIFPEGTRTPDGEIHEMERGIALVIRRAKVPVLPAVIDGSYEAWKGRKIFRPWPIRVCYGPVMELARFDGKKIPEIVGEILRGMFDALREADRAGDIDGQALDARVCALSAAVMASAIGGAAMGRRRSGKSSEKTPEAKSASTI